MSIVMQINPFEFFVDADGDALDSGYIWIGEPNTYSPQFPVAVFYDEALTIPAAMPLRTSNGYVVRNGSPTFLYVDGNYSVLVQDSRRRQVYYVRDFLLIGSQSAVSKGELAGPGGGDLVGWDRNLLTGAITTVGHMLDQQDISVWEFESLITSKPNPADFTTWDWYPAIQGAIDYATANGPCTVKLAMGQMGVSQPVEMKSNVYLLGYGDISSIQGRFAAPTNRIVTSSPSVLQTNIKLKNFKVDRTVINSQHGIILGGIDGLEIDGVHVFGFGPGVDSGAMGISPFNVYASIQSSNVLIKNCIITRCNNFGIAFGNVKGGKIIQNTFYDCWREAIGLEAWGAGVGVIEGCYVAFNTLYMSTSAANHFVGSIGPAILIGGAGAASGGKVVGNTITQNVVIIEDPVGQPTYFGISIVGAPTQEAAGNIVSQNVIINSPAAGLTVGTLGVITRENVITDNILINPCTASGAGALIARGAVGNVMTGNKISGSAHSVAVDEQIGSLLNMFLDNYSNSHTGAYSTLNPNSGSAIRDPRVAQLAGGVMAQEKFNLANGGSASTRSRGVNPERSLMLISSNFGGNYALILMIGSFAPTVISKSSDVIVGATDAGTPAALTLFPSTQTTLGLVNRLGSTRDFVVTTFGVE